MDMDARSAQGYRRPVFGRLDNVHPLLPSLVMNERGQQYQDRKGLKSLNLGRKMPRRRAIMRSQQPMMLSIYETLRDGLQAETRAAARVQGGITLEKIGHYYDR